MNPTPQQILDVLPGHTLVAATEVADLELAEGVQVKLSLSANHTVQVYVPSDNIGHGFTHRSVGLFRFDAGNERWIQIDQGRDAYSSLQRAVDHALREAYA